MASTFGRAVERQTAIAKRRMKRPVKLMRRVSVPGSAPFCTNPLSAVHIVNRKIARPAVACIGVTIILVGSSALGYQK